MQFSNAIGNLKSFNLAGFLTFSYAIFLAGFFFVPNAVDQYKFFSVALFIPGLFIVRKTFNWLAKSALWYLLLLYLVYMLASSFWSAEFSGVEFVNTVRLAAYIAMFVMITVHVHGHSAAALENILKLLCVSAATAAAVSMVFWYAAADSAPGARLTGIGTIENPNPSAFVYGFFAVLSAYYALKEARPALKTGFSGLAVILAWFVLLTGSNTGILATNLSLTVLFVTYRHNLKTLLALGLLGIALAALYLLSSIGALSEAMDHGFSERLKIWRFVVEQVTAAPLVGNGYQQTLLMTAGGDVSILNYAHNAFLATARDSGLIGLALQLLMLAAALRAAMVLRIDQDDPIYLVMLLFGFICMLADTDQLITRPRELWVIYWLPLAVILSRYHLHQERCAH